MKLCKLLTWNIRGLGRLEKCRAVRRRVQKEKANVLFIQETKAENINRAKLKSIWGTDSGEIVTSPAVRSSGGLACIWDSSFFTKRWCFLHQAFTIIVGKFQGFEEECGLVNLYALNDPAERRATFMMLEERHFAQVYNSRNSGAIKDLEGKFKAISANTQDWLERKFETEESLGGKEFVTRHVARHPWTYGRLIRGDSIYWNIDSGSVLEAEN
ncbi:hypothetical protein V6N13_133796 [Hibiscus sabdariffa]